jgi:hypothetical protein
MNKQRAIRHLNRHYSRENTIARDFFASVGAGFLLALVCVTGIIYVWDHVAAIDSKLNEVISWIVLKITI